MKKLLLLAFLCITLCADIHAQQVTETVFGDSGWNMPYKLWQMPDGNLAVVSGFLSEKRIHHIDLAGNLLGTYPLPYPTGSDFVEKAPDGATFYYGSIGASGYTVYHLDLTGHTLDSITYNPPDPVWDDYAFAIDQAPNGDIVLAYEDQEPPEGVRVVRVNQQGNVVFNKYISSSDPDFYAPHLVVLPNGRTVVVILDYSLGYRVNCYSPTGSLLWTKGVPQIPGFPEEMGLVPLGNGYTVFFGHQGFVGNTWVDGYAAAYKPDGNYAYNRTFETDLPNFQPYAAFADGDALVLAGNFSDANEYGLGIIKLDAGGQTLFVKKFHLLSGTDEMTAILSLNGDYIIGGYQWEEILPFGGYQSDKGYLLSLQPDGTFNWFAAGLDAEARLMTSICHLNNGDIVALGQAFQNIPGITKHFLLHVSGIGPIYSQLIEGQLIQDSILNCQPDAVEPALEGWVLKAETPNGNRYAVSDATGNYNIRLNAASANVLVTMPNALWEPCQPSYPVSFAGAIDTVSLSIPVQQVEQCPFFSLEVTAPFLRRCFDNTYYFYWCNNGTVVAENAILRVVLDSLSDYISASLPLAGQNGQVLTFQLGNLEPGQCGSLNLVANISCDAQLGEIHCLTANIASDNNCPNLLNPGADDRDCQANIGAFDPNDKRAFVDGAIREEVILPNTEIEYQIRFQNTGTDTAFNVVIVDTLDNTLDFNTLRPGIASHPYSFQLQGDQVAKFIFNHINLPDSNINQVASNGFVNFTVAQKPNLPILTEIRNQAGIYFDYNAAVVTNTQKLIVSNSISSAAPTDFSARIEVYPNPAEQGECWIYCTDPDRFLKQLSIFDATGRLVSTLWPSSNKTRLQLPENRGVYWIKAVLDDGRSTIERVTR